MICCFKKAIIYNHYRKLKLIKTTPFSKIYLCNSIKHNKNYILKIQSPIKNNNNIKGEIEILKYLKQCNYVVDLIYSEITFFNIYQIFNKIDGVTLGEYLNTSPNKIELINNILIAFKEIGKYGIIHRDIKFDNIMVEHHKIIIIDFGLSCYQKELKEFKSNYSAGTYQFMCPEMFAVDYYNANCDTWSLGVLFYFIITNKFPYKIKVKNIEKYRNFRMIPDEIKQFKLDSTIDHFELIKTMLIIDKNNRPLINELSEY